MGSSITRVRLRCGVLVVGIMVCLSYGVSAGQDAPDSTGYSHDVEGSGEPGTKPPLASGVVSEFVDALSSGRPVFNLRLRAEYADASGGLRGSQAYTSRLRLGYETGEFHGLTLLADFEDIRSAADSLYNAAGLNGQPDRTVVAEPEATELNQAYAKYKIPSVDATVTVGRQRLIIDDSRFIGNIGWRQNEQTLDAARLDLTPGENLTLQYVYFWEVNRIFGDDQSPMAPTVLRDFESDSHSIHLNYTPHPWVTLSAFSYLFEFSGSNPTARANSSYTHGVRTQGSLPVGDDDMSLSYVGSFAHQLDSVDNPTDYRANYFYGEVALQMSALGRVSVGYEELGTHHGRAQFRTPLSTAHKFNGWADSFLDNGGPKGLVDQFLAISPKLPYELEGVLIFHKFNSADGRGNRGWEIDARVTRALTKNLKALLKGGYFEGPQDPHILRLWFDLTLAF